jgi:hypothetical protein
VGQVDVYVALRIWAESRISPDDIEPRILRFGLPAQRRVQIFWTRNR